MASHSLSAWRLHRCLHVLDLQHIFQKPQSFLNPGVGGHFLLHQSFGRSICSGSSLTKQWLIPSGRRSTVICLKDYSGVICQVPVTHWEEGTRSMSTMNAPAGARKVALKLTMLSPGFVYEPYEVREPISFWRRWFTPNGWRRTKEDLIMEMKSAFAISRLRKVTGYSKRSFYEHAIGMYKEVNTLIANGDASSLRKMVTDKMYSTLKNELKRRKTTWSSVHWELVEPVVSIRTLRARMIALDKNDLNKSFVQLTIEFMVKQVVSYLSFY